MLFLLAFTFFISFSENASISSLLAISSVSTDETNLTINYKLF